MFSRLGGRAFLLGLPAAKTSVMATDKPETDDSLRGQAAATGLTILLVLSTVAWRFQEAWGLILLVPLGLSALTILWGLIGGLSGSRVLWPAFLMIWATALSLIFATENTKLGEFLWPCAAACQGGKEFSAVWGIPVWLPASAGYLLAAVLGLIGRKVSWCDSVSRLLAWAFLGCSIYYCILSWHLEMACGHCLSVHTAVLCMLGALIRHPLPHPLVRILVPMAAGLALHTVFHPFQSLVPNEPVKAVSGPETFANAFKKGEQVQAGSLDDASLDALMRAEAGRRFGRADAPVQGEFIVRLSCPHCKEAWEALAGSVSQQISSGKMALTIRFHFGVGASDDRELARLCLAAAYQGKLEQALWLVLGSSTDQARARLMAQRDLENVETIAKTQVFAFDRLLDRDLRSNQKVLRPALLGQARTTPYLVVRQGAAEIGVWAGTATNWNAVGKTLTGKEVLK